MAGYSIPAAEHSTITSWGREREVDAYRNMLRQFGKPGAIVAVVSDSYDIYRAISEHWGTTLRDEVIASGATLVIRPDSGDPVDVVAESLRRLDEAFGHTLNGKGYRVLNHVRVIQGDGINPDTIRAILQRITGDGYSADNVAFGMGGALLQRLDRDTQKFALKCSAARVEGAWIDVYKDPVTDAGKTSKRGRMRLLRRLDDGSLHTVALPPSGDEALPTGFEDAMVTVWENGRLLHDQRLDDIRPGPQRGAEGICGGRARCGATGIRPRALTLQPTGPPCTRRRYPAVAGWRGVKRESGEGASCAHSELPRSGEWKRILPTALGSRLGSGRE